MYINPNKLPQTESIPRGPFEKTARVLGTYSNKEYRTKDQVRELTRQMKFSDERLKSKMNDILYSYIGKDMDKVQKYVIDYIKLGGTKESLEQAISKVEVGRNVPVDTAATMKYGTSKSPVKQNLYQEYMDAYQQ